jgi:hypothetical protein
MMSGNFTAGQPERSRLRSRRGGTSARRLLATAVLVAGSVAALAAPSAQALTHPGSGAAAQRPLSGSGPSARQRLWHPTAFGRSQWVTPVAQPASTPGAGTGGGWQTEPTPNPGGLANGTVAAISCRGSRACIAVGYYVNDAGTTVTLAQVWNGTAWHTQATPNPAGSGGSQLSGISCDGPYACTASGYYLDAAGVTVPLAERWNGASWRIQAVPSPADATASGLFAISCPAALACTAVGTYDVSTGQALTLAEGWNGRSWHVEATPSPAGAIATQLDGVSCTSARACIAAGGWEAGSGALATVAEVWNGTGWHIQRTPGVPGTTSTEFTSVSCAAAYACTASGYSRDSSGAAVLLAERWNGVGWQVQSAPIPAGAAASELGAVSCPQARACTAVGAYFTGSDVIKTLAEAWNGSAWVIHATPNPAGASNSQLNGVSCPSPGTCASAGTSVGSTGFGVPMAEAWNGTAWRIHAIPSPTGARSSQLEGVSCASATACTAVGTYQNSPLTNATLAETWNGTAWSLQATPNPAGSIDSNLQAVSCASPSACIAVGTYLDHPAGATFALAESWNGTAWNLQHIPTPAGAKYVALEAVSCTAVDACTAIGFYRNHAQVQQGLAETWNGTSWTIQTIAEPGQLSLLFGVDCNSASACTAVGWYNTGTGDAEPLAEAWNGTSWQVQKVVLPAGSQGGSLSSVSCTTATACTATGSYFASPGGAFAERWNGTTWSFQSVPYPPNYQTSTSQIVLSAVACRSASACVAVGNYTPNNTPATFAAVWNGTKWSLRPIDLPVGTIGSILTGMSCAASHCVAAGSYFGQSQLFVTLAVTP